MPNNSTSPTSAGLVGRCALHMFSPFHLNRRPRFVFGLPDVRQQNNGRIIVESARHLSLLERKRERALPKPAIVIPLAHTYGQDRTLPGAHQEQQAQRPALRKAPRQHHSVSQPKVP